jgi:hypothetical protein
MMAQAALGRARSVTAGSAYFLGVAGLTVDLYLVAGLCFFFISESAGLPDWLYRISHPFFGGLGLGLLGVPVGVAAAALGSFTRAKSAADHPDFALGTSGLRLGVVAILLWLVAIPLAFGLLALFSALGLWRP